MGKILSSSMDKELMCVHCRRVFVFSISEQEYYKIHLLAQPKRCKRCRGLKTVQTVSKSNNPYAGLKSMLPGLYKGNFKGGIDVTDISGWKWRPKHRTNYC